MGHLGHNRNFRDTPESGDADDGWDTIDFPVQATVAKCGAQVSRRLLAGSCDCNVVAVVVAAAAVMVVTLGFRLHVLQVGEVMGCTSRLVKSQVAGW